MCLPEKRHSCIDYICLSFSPVRFLMCPQIKCLRVFSKLLHKKRQNHIDNICLTFLHCAFSNVFSKLLHKKRQNRIDYICLTSLQCVFSKGFSNHLPDMRMQSNIDRICTTSLHWGFGLLFHNSFWHWSNLLNFLPLCLFLFSNASIWMSSQSEGVFTFFILISASKRPSSESTKIALSLGK